MAGQSELEAFKLNVTSETSAGVEYDATLTDNEYASSFTPGTSDFRSGGGVVVWEDAGTPRLLVLSTQMGESFLNVCSKFAQWIDDY